MIDESFERLVPALAQAEVNRAQVNTVRLARGWPRHRAQGVARSVARARPAN